MKRIAIVLSSFLVATLLHAASFDCEKAQSRIEHMICDNQEISKLDDDLSVAYRAAQEDERQAKVIQQSQRQWIKYRNGCKDIDCIKRAYEMRLSSLTVTHVDTFGEADATQESTPPTSSSIDMREPGYPFNLKEGKGVEVCEIYRKNLELLDNPNLACARKVSPEYEGIIRLPQWRKLDFWENRNLWAKVEAVATGAYDEQSIDAKIDLVEQREIDRLARRYQVHAEQFHEEAYKIYRTELDVDNDGRKEIVLRETSGLCGEPEHLKSIGLFVWDEKKGAVDIAKSRSLFQDSKSNPYDTAIQENGTVGNGSMYDFFVYKEKTYFDRWTWTGVWIYAVSGGQVEAICHIN